MRKKTTDQPDAGAVAWPQSSGKLRGPLPRAQQPAAEAVPARLPRESPKPRRSPNPANCLFVNQIGDRIVGVVRLIKSGPGTARIVVFRVDPEWCHTSVVTGLLESIQSHCRQHGCLRVLVDFSVAPPWMSNVLRGHGFRMLWGHRTWEATLARSPQRVPPGFPLNLAANSYRRPPRNEAN